jgi:hypothetical protein
VNQNRQVAIKQTSAAVRRRQGLPGGMDIWHVNVPRRQASPSPGTHAAPPQQGVPSTPQVVHFPLRYPHVDGSTQMPPVAVVCLPVVCHRHTAPLRQASALSLPKSFEQQSCPI